MTWAIAAGSIIGGGLSLAASGKQARAGEDAANASLAAGRDATARLAPFVNSGVAANNKLMTLLGLGSRVDETTPGFNAYYQPLLDQADKDFKARFGFGINDPQAQNNDTLDYITRLKNTASDQFLAANPGYSSTYGSLLKPFTGDSLTSEPGYQFGLSEGQKAIDRAAAAAGRYDSGATLKALTRYGEDYAGTKYNDAFNRDAATKSQTYGFLSGQSGQGVNAAGQQAGLGLNAANAAANYGTQAADASAAGLIGAGNAVTSGVNSYLNYQNQNSVLNYLKGLRNGGVSSGGGWGGTAGTFGGS